MKFKKTHILIFLLFLFIAGAWWSFKVLEKDRNFVSPAEDIVPEIESDEWLEYADDRLGFSIQYPPHWFYEENDGIEFTPLSPEDPKRRSSIGLASTLSIREVSASQMSELEQFSATVEDVEINGRQGTLFLIPNAYAGGFNKHYIFPLSKENYLQVSFYGGEFNPDIYPFEKMVSTLRIR
jgi:hypothetical protein